MKTINVTFTQREYEELTTRKADHTWRDFILRRSGVSQDEGVNMSEQVTDKGKKYQVMCKLWDKHCKKYQDEFSQVELDFGNLFAICTEFHEKIIK